IHTQVKHAHLVFSCTFRNAVRSPIVTAIVVDQLRKSYGDLEAVKGISLTVAEGEIFALLGPNGAGKTTTVEILEGYRPRSGGDVRGLGCEQPAGSGRRG